MNYSSFLTWRFFSALSLMLVATSLQAGSLYKCQGKNGETAYTNRPENFSQCVTVANYVDAPAKAASASHASPVTKPHWEYQELSNGKAEIAPSTEQDSPQSDTPVETKKSVTNASSKVLRGSVYKVERSKGITEYTNVKPSTGQYNLLFTYIANCAACDTHSTINWDSTTLNLSAYQEEVSKAAAEFNVDESWLRAVIHAESAFNPYAVSRKGAQGLMQIMPATAQDLGVVDAFDPMQNIRGGAQYLATLLKNFNGDERLATAAYNAGESTVQKYSGVPPYDETRVYVERVATLHERYRKAM